jgi:hypothetical protein
VGEYETDLSAKKIKTTKNARFFKEKKNKKRPEGFKKSPEKKQKEIVCLDA